MRSLLVAAVLTLAGCGTAKPVPDAGIVIDTSCGLDCVAQKNYGLIINTCFEYADSPTASDPPAIGALVKDLFTLEGGIKTIPVEYRASGQTKMIDYFGITNGTLLLMRREFSAGQSVTFKNTANDIVGVGWLERGSDVGSNLASSSNADVLAGPSNRKSELTSYRVTLAEASVAQRTVPAQADAFDGGIQMLFSESPDHGSDALRVWVPQVGFISFSTSFQLSGGTAQQYHLQKLRTVGTADKPCSLGTP
jgi:hypothetical protein